MTSFCLRGDYLNTMFVVTLPIAFGMAMENNLDYCTWFLTRLKEALGVAREVSLITNMDDVVSFCICHAFPYSHHGDTSKSVFMYMCIICISSRILEPLLWLASKSYTMCNFEQNVLQLTYDEHEVLVNIGYAKWARSYFPNIHWNVLNIDIP
uniref:Uncharacterized protein n=1 Tax=Lactuca sativa TaxID=4236 RepID=A0A9R1VLA2_LACSA|nr:hypothetical protein LSAT_V11C500248930 [Lactuca sativa]